MALDWDELKKLLREKGVKSLDDFNPFMRDVSKEVVETLLEGELTDHLGYEKHDQKTKATENARNGHTPKTVKSKFGEIDLEVPRDRKSDFEPQIVKKRQKDISGLEEKIISMYAKGMTTRDIQEHIKDLYGYEISAETVSSITDKVLERAREWQGRPLESVYALIYMDAVFLKMRLEGHVRLQVPSGDPGPCLYDESDREPEPEDQESGQEQGDLPQRPGSNQAGLPGR